MLVLSTGELVLVRNAFEQAWRRAERDRLVQGWNVADLEDSLVRGILKALAVGEREELTLAAAALGQLQIDWETNAALLTATYHCGGSSIH
jgi:hypothetical protein